jgi:hypothetical protein
LSLRDSNFRTGKHDYARKLENPVNLTPGRQIPRGIRAEQQNEIGIRLAAPQGSQRVHCIGWSRTIQLLTVELEPALGGDSQRQHFGPVLGRAPVPALLEWLLAGRQESQ